MENEDDRPTHSTRINVTTRARRGDCHPSCHRGRRVNRRYLESRLAYRLQEAAYGGLPRAIKEQLADCGERLSKIKAGRGAEVRLMPGEDRHQLDVPNARPDHAGAGHRGGHPGRDLAAARHRA
ncbi:DUF2924 domain-containing protein [Accumulibacter sp.]|uniref:DUF2924 domain-containing protein n=1 Tax=Accumulibacter sp. TaxID=2053492 RepID=UPI001AC52D83|nr:DUF2924 domain-containing protein [Accumulibacter sp.]MBN8453872.1 DUF2924 domain-containing protein [Accumulibacter sp.]